MAKHNLTGEQENHRTFNFQQSYIFLKAEHDPFEREIYSSIFLKRLVSFTIHVTLIPLYLALSCPLQCLLKNVMAQKLEFKIKCAKYPHTIFLYEAKSSNEKFTSSKIIHFFSARYLCTWQIYGKTTFLFVYFTVTLKSSFLHEKEYPILHKSVESSSYYYTIYLPFCPCSAEQIIWHFPEILVFLKGL